MYNNSNTTAKSMKTMYEDITKFNRIEYDKYDHKLHRNKVI